MSSRIVEFVELVEAPSGKAYYKRRKESGWSDLPKSVKDEIARLRRNSLVHKSYGNRTEKWKLMEIAKSIKLSIEKFEKNRLREQAAVVIQKYWREKLSIKELENNRLREQAAVVIQRFWRENHIPKSFIIPGGYRNLLDLVILRDTEENTFRFRLGTSVDQEHLVTGVRNGGVITYTAGASLEIGDELLTINGVDVTTKSHEETLALVRGTDRLSICLARYGENMDNEQPNIGEDIVWPSGWDIGYTIQISRPNNESSFGFGLGRTDDGESVITTLAPGRNSQKLLRLGDVVLEVDGISTNTMSHEETIEKMLVSTVTTLTISRRMAYDEESVGFQIDDTNWIKYCDCVNEVCDDYGADGEDVEDNILTIAGDTTNISGVFFQNPPQTDYESSQEYFDAETGSTQEEWVNLPLACAETPQHFVEPSSYKDTLYSVANTTSQLLGVGIGFVAEQSIWLYNKATKPTALDLCADMLTEMTKWKEDHEEGLLPGTWSSYLVETKWLKVQPEFVISAMADITQDDKRTIVRMVIEAGQSGLFGDESDRIIMDFKNVLAKRA